MKTTIKAIMDAALKAARDFGFEDSEKAFWQCDVFSSAVMKVAKLMNVTGIEMVQVTATWITPSGGFESGHVDNHTLLRFDNKYYDFTIRQLNANEKFPYIDKNLPTYMKNPHRETVLGANMFDLKYIDQILFHLENLK